MNIIFTRQTETITKTNKTRSLEPDKKVQEGKKSAITWSLTNRQIYLTLLN